VRVRKLQIVGMKPRITALIACAATLILLDGCGGSSDNSAAAVAPIAAKPDVIITIDGKQHACVVALYSEEHGSAIPCDDLVRFLRDELKVQSGSIYDMRTIPVISEAEMTGVAASLKSAGYRFIGGAHDKEITKANSGPGTRRGP
jgi:hypothetical protein